MRSLQAINIPDTAIKLMPIIFRYVGQISNNNLPQIAANIKYE